MNKRICPVVCPRGEHAEGEQCVANETPPPKHASYCQGGPANGVAVSSGSNACR
jgi:hypothetical protein